MLRLEDLLYLLVLLHYRELPVSDFRLHYSDTVFASLLAICRSSATNRLIEAKDKASVQINIGHVNGEQQQQRQEQQQTRCCGNSGKQLPEQQPEQQLCRNSSFASRSASHTLTQPSTLSFALSSAADGVYTGEWSTMAICGFVRGMGEADGAFDRLWTKCYEDAKGSI